MDVRPLTYQDVDSWANLLAICFHRNKSEMIALLGWLDGMGDLVAWGAWQDNQLIAQYACLIRSICAYDKTFKAGMSINMAVHPAHRGRGLTKQVARPVYDNVREKGGTIGLGFSNAAGVHVDRNSNSYGYQVIGQMQPMIGLLRHAAHPNIQLSNHLSTHLQRLPTNKPGDAITFLKTPTDLATRYVAHPFRWYQYGIWQEGEQICGLVVYRKIRIAGIPGVALLEAWGADLRSLITQWVGAIRKTGALFVHVLLTPAHPLRNTVAAIIPMFSQPYTRNPYFLTIKPLVHNLPNYFFQFDSWQFVGGDVL